MKRKGLIPSVDGYGGKLALFFSGQTPKDDNQWVA